MTKLHIYPEFAGEDDGDGGVRRVVEGQVAHLPALGFELTGNAADADVIACHITAPDTYVNLHPQTPLVGHCHGLYWSEYPWWEWALKANAQVMELLRIADVVTAPSEWVAMALRRHTSRRVLVIPHGIDLKEWKPGKNEKYVLWNKTRPDPVCDPAPMNELAKLMPEQLFISTFGVEGQEEAENVVLTGRVSFDKAREVVRSAGVYLCTARETFGIGTLEALACGVPIVGFAHGGQREIISQEVDGYLVEPGDIAGLADGVRWAAANRKEIAARAREKASRYPWTRAAELYAEAYELAIDEKATKRSFQGAKPVKVPKVSVVVTAYDLERYLPDTLRSVAAQTLRDWECIIVDDSSPDGCGLIADHFAEEDDRFRVIHNADNQYLAGARNTAIAAARGSYVLPLDADDMLTPRTLELLAGALDADRTIHIAYGGVLFVDEDGATPTDYGVAGKAAGHSGWPMEFRFEWQARSRNLLPYCSMYRRSVWAQTGGYRRRCRTAEDADFWLRASSYGFRPKMVTTADTLVYRNREGSMSRDVGAREWNHWFPWGADLDLAPAGAVTEEQMPVASLDPPRVSVIIPVGPEHWDIVADAVDSVDAQSLRDWECIVVNDSGKTLTHLPPWVRVIEGASFDGHGVAAARNAGVRASRAPFFVPLDADDLLEPHALQWLMTALEFAADDVEIIYSDFWEDPEAPGQFQAYANPDYDPQKLVAHGALHPVTALTSRRAWEVIGGYDETLGCWEDWSFALAAVEAGICSQRLATPLYTYRKHTGRRRESNQVSFEQCRKAILDRFARFWNGEKSIMGCGCGRKPTIRPPNATPASQTVNARQEGATQVRYTGIKVGGFTFRGRSGATYTFSAGEPPHWVMADDVEKFRNRIDFEVLDGLADATTPGSPELVAEGPPGQRSTPPGPPDVDPKMAGAALTRSMPAAVAAAIAPAPAPPPPAPRADEPTAEPRSSNDQPTEPPRDVPLTQVDPERAIAGLMEMGVSRADAEKRVGR